MHQCPLSPAVPLLSNEVVVTLFNSSHSNRDVVVPHCGFNFNVPNDMTMGVFLCAHLLSIYPLGWSIFSDHLSFIVLGCLFAYYWVWLFFVYFECKSSPRCMVCKYFLLFWGLTFHSVSQRAEVVLNFDEVQFLKFFFFGVILLVSYLWNLCLSEGHKNFLQKFCSFELYI